MLKQYLVKNGTLLSILNGEEKKSDILVTDGVVTEIAEHIEAPEADVIDAEGIGEDDRGHLAQQDGVGDLAGDFFDLFDQVIVFRVRVPCYALDHLFFVESFCNFLTNKVFLEGNRSIGFALFPAHFLQVFDAPLHIFNQFPLGNDDVRLFLNVPAVGVAKHDPQIVQNFRLNLTLDQLTVFDGRVIIEMHTAVTGDSRISQKFSVLCNDLVPLHDGSNLVVDGGYTCM